MKARITLSLLVLAMAGMMFAQTATTTTEPVHVTPEQASPITAPKGSMTVPAPEVKPCPTEVSATPDPYPPTDAEQLAIRNAESAINQANVHKNSAPENAVVAKAEAEVEKTKEYKNFLKAQEKLKATPQVKAYQTASTALQQANLDAPVTKAQQELDRIGTEMYTQRHLSREDWIICDGPSPQFAVCKDVGANKIELRSLKPAAAKK